MSSRSLECSRRWIAMLAIMERRSRVARIKQGRMRRSGPPSDPGADPLGAGACLHLSILLAGRCRGKEARAPNSRIARFWRRSIFRGLPNRLSLAAVDVGSCIRAKKSPPNCLVLELPKHTPNPAEPEPTFPAPLLPQICRFPAGFSRLCKRSRVPLGPGGRTRHAAVRARRNRSPWKGWVRSPESLPSCTRSRAEGTRGGPGRSNGSARPGQWPELGASGEHLGRPDRLLHRARGKHASVVPPGAGRGRPPPVSVQPVPGPSTRGRWCRSRRPLGAGYSSRPGQRPLPRLIHNGSRQSPRGDGGVKKGRSWGFPYPALCHSIQILSHR
jgi:hypothetical protein